MKKSINNFENKTNLISKKGMNSIYGGHVGKGYSRPKPKTNSSSGSGHVTILK